MGQVVISKRGKDVGHIYVIAGFLAKNRLALVDTKHFSVSRPKSKNPRHIQTTRRFLDAETMASIEKGREIDHEELRRFLRTSEESV